MIKKEFLYILGFVVVIAFLKRNTAVSEDEDTNKPLALFRIS